MSPPRSFERPSEADRLAALASYGVLDTPREKDFDDLAALASAICETPIAVVNLIGEGRQFFKAEVGLGVRETPLESSFCARAILEEEFLLVPDATADPRFDCNPLVTGVPHLRFYAGALMKTESGHALGTVCVLDFRPRQLSPVQMQTLAVLARQAMTQLELRRTLAMRSLDVERKGILLRLGDLLRDAGSTEEVTAAAAETLGQVLGAGRAGYATAELATERIVIESDWTAPGVRSLVGTHRFAGYGGMGPALGRGETVAITDLALDPRTARHSATYAAFGIRSALHVPIVERGELVGILFAHDPEPRGWTDDLQDLARSVADRTRAAIARLNAEAQQRLMNEELSHRLKNTLALVQAIASQTLKGAADRDAVDAFESRLRALGTAHDVLLQQSWSAARISAVAEGVVGLHAERSRFAVSGPDITLGPRSALSLSLLLHELATNAVKHGALSTESGQVELAWRIEDGEAEPTFAMRWQERGGPPVREPDKRGFGSRLIRMGLSGTGHAVKRYDPSGFSAEFKAPVALLQNN